MFEKKLSKQKQLFRHHDYLVETKQWSLMQDFPIFLFFPEIIRKPEVTKKWSPQNCSYRLCKTCINGVGFIEIQYFLLNVTYVVL